jgi:hypothetical protein
MARTIKLMQSFDLTSRQVGEFILQDESLLPPTPDWHIGLGFVATKTGPGKYNVEEYDLKVLAIVPDKMFRAWASQDLEDSDPETVDEMRAFLEKRGLDRCETESADRCAECALIGWRLARGSQ